MSGARLVTAALALCMLAGIPLGAQTAHYGTVLTLGGGFSTPTGVTVDAKGNVYVADNGNSVIKEILAVNGNISASPTINTLGSGFANPFTMAVDASGDVYVADYGNHAVKEIVAVNGSIPASPTIRTLASGLTFIFGTALDSQGDLFFTEYGKNEVKEMLAVNGVIPDSPTINILGSGFNIPAGLAVDGSDNVYVGDQNNNVVKEILAAGGYTTVNTVATGFSTPDGVAIDASGNVYVADDGANLAQEIVGVNGIIPASPTILTLPGSYQQTFDVAVDLSGNVYVADRGNNAVKEIQVAGLNFGQFNVGTASPNPLTVNFTFDTAGTLGSTAVVTQSAGATAMDFTNAGSGTCVANTAYSAGQVCTVIVNFSPTAPGPRYGSVQLLNTAGALIATGYVQGTGVAPQITFTTPSSSASLPSVQYSVGSGFSNPLGVAVDASRNIFVADASDNQVKEITAASALTTVVTLAGGFNFPSNLAVDGGGNVFVADTFNNAVKEIVAAGGYTTVLTLGSGFNEPYGVAVDGSGNVFVADYGNGAVKEMLAVNGAIPASPNIRTLARGRSGPVAVAVDSSGDVFVADFNTGEVQEIPAVSGSIPASPTIKTIATDFGGYPADIALDASGNVFVVDTDNTVKEILAASGYATILTLGSGFNNPNALAVDSHGNVIVADSGNAAIQFLDFTDLPSVAFANTIAGLTSTDSPQTVTVSNNGNANLVFSALSYPTDFPEASGVSTDCKANTVLAPGKSCTISTSFSPKTSSLVGSSTALSEYVNITTNSLNQSTAEALQVLGTVIQPAPAVTLSATSLSFPTTVVGLSSTLPVTVTDSGAGNLSITAFTNSGANPGLFTHTSNCGGVKIAQGAFCTVQLIFKPTAVGSFSATFSITDNAPGSPQVITLSGTGLGVPAVTLTPTSLSFPSVPVGQSSTLPVTVTNSGSASLSVTAFANSGANPGLFTHTSNCGGVKIAPGAFCTVQLTFKPTAAGSFSATFNITDNAPGSPHPITLSGTGTGTSAVKLSPTTLTFPTTAVGLTSTIPVTVTNSGSASLSVSAFANSGANPGLFTHTSNCGGVKIAPGSHCTVQLTFTPSAVGSFSATFNITDTAPGSPHAITLSGTGGPPPGK